MKTVILSRIRKVTAGAAAAACAAVLAVTGCATAGPAAEKSTVTATVAEAQEISSDFAGTASPDTVTVNAKGSAYAAPDRAELQFGIRTQAKTAQEAQKDNSKKVDAVVKVLKQKGIQDENIQTTMYDVSTQYDWSTGDGTNIIGYSVYSGLSVRDVAVDETGGLITACTEAGAKEFNGISYHCTNYDELYGQALQQAVSNAKNKAGSLAQAAGRKVGDVRMIVEGYQDMTYADNTAKTSAATGMDAMDESGISASLMPGQAEITATVTVTYVLQ